MTYVTLYRYGRTNKIRVKNVGYSYDTIVYYTILHYYYIPSVTFSNEIKTCTRTGYRLLVYYLRIFKLYIQHVSSSYTVLVV